MSEHDKSQTIYESEHQGHTELDYQGEGSRSSAATIADRPRFRLNHEIMVVVSLVIIVAMSAAFFARDSVLYARTDDAHIDGHITPVSARINGQVQQVNVIEGQLVHAGDVLAVMDQSECSIAVNLAMANLKVAQTASQEVSIAKAKAQAADPDYGEPVTIGTGSTQT